ncbi:MAG: hypothetical protein JRI68_30535 [Deltaproteobacteria bacterium]|nr:hypothetical protein [Deltaproteobacteria bacterium]
MRRALLLIPLVVSGCAAAPTPEAAEPKTPVIDVDDDRHTAKSAQDKASEAKVRAKTRAAEIARALAEIDVQTIGALGDGQTVADVLSASDVPAGLLDEELKGGVTTAPQGGLKLGGGAAGGGASLTAIGPGSGVATSRSAVKPPTGSVAVKAQVAKGKVANAASVVARMRGRFRRCYAHGQKSDPSLAGTLTLVAAIGAKGEVLSVAGGEKSSLKAFVPCVKAVIASAMFAPPDGGSAAVSVEATFTKMP